MLNRKHWILIVLTPLAVIADQVTKTFALRLLESRGVRTIIPDYLNLVLVKNRGMAFGLLNDLEGAWRVPLFIGIGVIAIFIIIHLFRQAEKNAFFLPMSLSLILSGAVGNLIDRFRWGYVVDFINIHYLKHHWPTFNVADTAITAGIIILILDTLLTPAEKRDETGDTEPPEDGGGGEAEIEETD